MKSFLREPLVHFLIIGVALFILFEVVNDPVGPQSNRVVITNGQIESLKARFVKTWQRQPTREELDELINGHVREEILYREALALGMDKDDGVVRRRMTQKLELMSDDIAGITIPSNEDLQDFLESHPELFRIEPQVAFRQIYIDVEKRGIAADMEAEQLLALLSETESKLDLDTVGDNLMLPRKFNLVAVSEIAKMFGEKFSLELIKCTKGQWVGPIQSGYGLHLVLVSDRVAGRLPGLEEVRGTVEWEWSTAHKKTVRDNIYNKLREKYTIEIEESGDGFKNAQTVTVAQAAQEMK
ncbi:peptidyl-prolyl cis-trans isomerase [Desulfosediminicola flagellatus]|uniref:peptidylprolyl isomerase n=1 Tax=Desulfosediminicola flagellatus TaxID=2569541 RepID=UPI0010ABE662|nr:peptidylprolyl isomerase [Desulfosediminicola flagellatus]